MQKTENYGLKKPESTDYYDVDSMVNENMDIIDSKMKELDDGLEGMKTSFQAGCDTIVAGCTTYGCTPTSNSPDDIVTAISEIYENRYDEGYDEGIEDAEPTLQTKSASLSTSAQTIKPDSGYDGLSQVTIPAVQGTATTDDVVASKTFASATGVDQIGNIADNRGVTVDASAISSDDTYTYFTPPAGCYDENSKIRTENSNLGAELLWTNPNPTNAFNPQTIELDLSNYKGILVESIISPNTNIKLTGYREFNYAHDGYIGGSNGSDTSYGRAFTISETSITFRNAVIKSSIDNSTIIPQKIYGTKFNL